MVGGVTQLHRMVLLAVLALALVATGFSHRAPNADDEALAVFLAVGGSTSDLCGDHGPATGHADRLCQACQIAGGADLPPEPGMPQRLRLTVGTTTVAQGESRHFARILNPAHGPQAPPIA